MQTSFRSFISGTPEENYKDTLVQIIKQMVVENKPVTITGVEEAIIRYNQTHPEKEILTKAEIVGGEFYKLVLAAVWNGIQEGTFMLAVSP